MAALEEATSLMQRWLAVHEDEEGNDTHANMRQEMRGFLSRQGAAEARPRNVVHLSLGPSYAPLAVALEVDSDFNDEVLVAEIDLSSADYLIGDEGCAALCESLLSTLPQHQQRHGEEGRSVSPWSTLDLEANGLSAASGTCLAAALMADALPHLTHLSLACNSLGAVPQLARALARCPHLDYLDVHGCSLGDEGCVALGDVLSSLPALTHLDLSANRIQDQGCTALAPLFTGACPRLTHLNLSENGIASISGLVTTTTTIVLHCLTTLDLRWNCITDLAVLADAWQVDDPASSSTSPCPALVALHLQGSALSDVACARLCVTLRTSGAAPQLDDDLLVLAPADDTVCAGVGEGRSRASLQGLASGTTTNTPLCDLTSQWGILTNHHGAVGKWSASSEITPQNAGHRAIPQSTRSRKAQPQPLDLLRRDGFVVESPISSTAHMAGLEELMEQVEGAGWPPVFVFMSDPVWDFVTQHVWPAVGDLLGEDCVLDPGSAFAWSLRATGKSTFPRDGEFRSWQNAVSGVNPTVPQERVEEGHRGFGSSFGLPHRDFSAAESMVRNDQEEVDDPTILTVWIPLNDATLENGCIYVVPREFDSDFDATDKRHAHMNPATEVQRGRSAKIHFPLHGVRALPAPAGSLLAWYGNTIHWGSTCSRYATEPRKSIALTFRRAATVSHDDNEVPPLIRTHAAALTPALRLSLIARSLLLYNQWHALADDAFPPLLHETTAVRCSTRKARSSKPS
jgi:hypothetical protein